jgi:hypothetical protein
MPSGGRRLGSGAPRGNLNALKTGRHSRRLRQGLLALRGDTLFLAAYRLVAQTQSASSRVRHGQPSAGSPEGSERGVEGPCSSLAAPSPLRPRRPGAPVGNTNALKIGRHSPRLRSLALALMADPSFLAVYQLLMQAAKNQSKTPPSSRTNSSRKPRLLKKQ